MYTYTHIANTYSRSEPEASSPLVYVLPPMRHTHTSTHRSTNLNTHIHTPFGIYTHTDTPCAHLSEIRAWGIVNTGTHAASYATHSHTHTHTHTHTHFHTPTHVHWYIHKHKHTLGRATRHKSLRHRDNRCLCCILCNTHTHTHTQILIHTHIHLGIYRHIDTPCEQLPEIWAWGIVTTGVCAAFCE